MKSKLLALAALLVLFSVLPSQATTLNSVVHGTVVDGPPEDGTSDYTITTVVAAANYPNGGGVQDRAVIEFDISSLTNPLSLATLDLTELNNLLGTRTFSVYGYTGDGALGTGDYLLGTSLGSFDLTGPSTVHFDVTAFVNAQIALNDPLHFVGFQVVWASPAESAFASFGNISTSMPTLTYATATTPLPAAFPLFATGLGALSLLGWRRKRKALAA